MNIKFDENSQSTNVKKALTFFQISLIISRNPLENPEN